MKSIINKILIQVLILFLKERKRIAITIKKKDRNNI